VLLLGGNGRFRGGRDGDVREGVDAGRRCGRWLGRRALGVGAGGCVLDVGLIEQFETYSESQYQELSIRFYHVWVMWGNKTSS
jgi:hypothetical protein